MSRELTSEEFEPLGCKKIGVGVQDTTTFRELTSERLELLDDKEERRRAECHVQRRAVVHFQAADP